MTSPLLRRFAGFAGLPLLSMAAPFLLLPLISRVGGVSGWAAILLGQSVGALGGVLGGLGWGLVGPAEVARADVEGRSRIYAESMASRLLALALVVPVCGGVAFALSSDGYRWTAAAMSSAMVLGALSPAWFSIGIGRPSGIAVYEIVPRLAATGLAAVLVLALRQVWVYPVLLIAATLVGTALYGRRVARVTFRGILTVRAVRALWSTRSATATVTIAGSYSSTPVLVVGAVEPTHAVATFGSADRVYRFSLTAIQVLTNALQAWVSEVPVPPGHRLSRRMRMALAVHTALGLAGLLGFAVLGPVTTRVLFGAEVATSETVAALYGTAYLAVALSSCLARLVLIPLRRTGLVLTSTTTGAVVGLAAMITLGATVGATGVAAGFALSEIAVVAVLAWALMRAPVGSPAREGVPIVRDSGRSGLTRPDLSG